MPVLVFRRERAGTARMQTLIAFTNVGGARTYGTVQATSKPVGVTVDEPKSCRHCPLRRTITSADSPSRR